MSLATIYCCDGCGAEVRFDETRHNGADLDGWRELRIQQMGLGVVHTRHICPKCRIVEESARDGPG